ncbi:DNA primase large subunit [Euwallacea fornicatus]|uniref:DNA primase large subunit n=1 Tax=Euwallacea fornicatus TaxID=995702 RepID=UPI0033905E32
MDLNARRRRAHITIIDTEKSFYSQDLTMYSEWPTVQTSLSEFEELAMERVQLLRIMEQSSLKGHKYFSEEWKQCIKEDLLKHGLKKYARVMSGFGGHTEADLAARRADYLSHFILRMSYCRSEDLRKWFIARELDWFKLKFLAQSTEAIQTFLQSNKLDYTPISKEEKEELKTELIESTRGMTDVIFPTMDFYKVPFKDILFLVKTKRVFLKLGFGFVPMSELVVCLLSKFRNILSESLSTTNHRLPHLADDRITDLLQTLHFSYTGNEYVVSDNKDAVNPADIDQFAKKHFPLCMRNMHETLRANHHLKHHSRLSYGLFLKAIGVQYENFIEFWRQEFTKKMDNEKFNKSYLYNFNHQFGKVGRMMDYLPYSCNKIIMGSVGPGEAHGCPFRHFDSVNLKAKLNEHGVSQEASRDIMGLVKNGHYQMACTKYFETTHGQAPALTISHPNQYYEESMNLVKEKAVKIDNK